MRTALNTLELAWAAGLFDAEGSAGVARNHRGRSLSPRISLSQAGTTLPPTLLRFHDAVGGLSLFVGPVRGYLYYWYSHRFEVIQAVCAQLWPWLSRPKRQQVACMLLAARRLPLTLREQATPRTDFLHELAWAAGFFVGEADLGARVVASPERQRFIRCEIAQASLGGVPPTLLRFHDAVLRIGAVRGPFTPRSPWSRLPQYRWRTQSYEGVQAVVALLWSWLDAKPRVEARRVLGLYRSLPNVEKGSQSSRATPSRRSSTPTAPSTIPIVMSSTPAEARPVRRAPWSWPTMPPAARSASSG